LHIIAQKADGAMRDALTIFDQTVAFCGADVHYEDVIRNLNVLDYEYSFRLVDAFRAGDYASALLTFDEKTQRFAAGFPFIDGAVIVARENAFLLTDSRYIEAAGKAAGGCAEVWCFDRQHKLLDLARQALAACGAQKLGAEENKLSYARYRDYEKQLGLPLQPAQKLLDELRASKDEEEIESLIRAQRISEAALEETLTVIRPGMSEKELAAELVYRMLRHGSEGNSFDPIVVSGPNTSLPHGVPGERLLQNGDFITMDFGSLKNGYCSDMTRTVALGTPTDEMRRIYEIVLEAQLAGIGLSLEGLHIGCSWISRPRLWP
jgi:Xaa-Pro aminopeptidase